MTSMHIKTTEGTEFFPCNATITFGGAGHPLKCMRACGHDGEHESTMLNYPVEADGKPASVVATVEWRVSFHQTQEPRK